MSRIDRDDGRKQRGQVSHELITEFAGKSDEALITMLKDKNAQLRTAAATLLGERKFESAVQPLCIALTKEKALYSRLAICEALVLMGEAAIGPLIDLLGKIGSNQHRALPEKGFYKRSYPLPRDIAARTLIRMGIPVLQKIAPVLRAGDRAQILEAIDVIGDISNQYMNDHCLGPLLAVYEDSSDDDLMQWKILRSFQAFPDQRVTDILLQVIQYSAIAPLRWEAVRSLGLQQRKFDRQFLVSLQNDEDVEMRKLRDLFFIG